MKALLLLVLPWLSPANYIDNVGSLHFLYSELVNEDKMRSYEGSLTMPVFGMIDYWLLFLCSHLCYTNCPRSYCSMNGPYACTGVCVPQIQDPNGARQEWHLELKRLNSLFFFLLSHVFGDTPQLSVIHRFHDTLSQVIRQDIDSDQSRPFERSTVKSRSFKKINRALSVLRRTKSGSAVANQADQGRENSEHTSSPEVFPRLYHLIPDGEVTCIKINRVDPNESLSIRLVGGSETPLVHIIIQHIYRGGLIARDGQLLPGDIILKVNGMDISNVPHQYALRLLRQPCQVLRLTVLREQKFRSRNNGQTLDFHGPRDGSFHVILNKSSPEEQLGIKLVRKVDEHGVFIYNMLNGGVADRQGQLEENDRVLAINGHDLRNGSPESAAHLIQASERRVPLVVSRQVRLQSPCIFQEAGWSGSSSPSPGQEDRSNIVKPPHPTITFHEKMVSVRKDPSESLGMTIAGGASHSEWDLPIYVISVEPGGVISRDGRIKTGDILLNVNGVELTAVNRSEAVALLKSTCSSVVLKALEVKEHAPQEDCSSPAALDSSHNMAPPGDWSPSWVMWLELPRYLYKCKDVILRRNTAGSLGFCIVGGYEEYNGNKPFFIKSIVEGTPAYNDGRIRCGDILLAVNGKSTSGMIYACLARMLKELKGKITLTIVSWPGTFL
ncbi:PREDICTED: E3 ubiquitin-protein ligase LNX [Condylura cristata]|uniref:E3 ubiquitin-protein ligase LNX n=1 Tax=Condylura cristata TaxID=143302 RepID=UPI0003344C73|nr:PREDICTED: E3 ubiquitin-protein ligase LNX [Condylura cristata]